MTQTDDSPLGPLELMESARVKYSLALARLRRGPPELALLSLHGSLEDALRSHALRHDLPAAIEPFPQLLNALASDTHTPLNRADAEAIRRMHRLRARVARGEHLAITTTTTDAYHRLVARLLPCYGVMVVGPEDEIETGTLPRPDTDPALSRRRIDDIEPIPPRRSPERGKTTTRLTPPRERSTYPGDEFARYAMRPSRSAGDRVPHGEDAGQIDVDTLADRWRRSQAWVLPLLIIVSILLIGAAISISLQQLRAVQSIPTPVLVTAIVIQNTPVVPQSSPSAVQLVSSTPPPQTVVATEPVATLSIQPEPGTISVGRAAQVRAEVGALNVRDRPGTNQSIPIIFVLQPGTRVDVVEGPVQADGLTWWKVRAVNQDGWCAGEFLEVK